MTKSDTAYFNEDCGGCAGYCAVTWHPTTRTTPNSFLLLGAAIAGQGLSAIGGCTETYVGIPGAVGYPNAQTLETFCGDGWFFTGTTAAPLGPIKSL